METILIRRFTAVIFSFFVYMRYIIGPGVSGTLPDHPSCVPMMEYECCGAVATLCGSPEAERGRIRRLGDIVGRRSRPGSGSETNRVVSVFFQVFAAAFLRKP